MIHILDWVLYFPLVGIVWAIIGGLSDGEFTEELGALIGCCFIILFTIIYCVVFYFYDWIDLFGGIMENVTL